MLGFSILISMKNMNRSKELMVVGMSKRFLFSFLCGFAFIFVVHAQDTSGFISIDCGIAENSSYTDNTTGLYYTSDTGYVDTGENNYISPDSRSNSLQQQFVTLRSFPRGIRNCYTLRPARGRGNKYLVRAYFMYGNYDAHNQRPQFDLHIGVNFWYTVVLPQTNNGRILEVIHIPTTDYISVCLINVGLGIPIISALELRPLDNSMYETASGSLNLYSRLYISGSKAKDFLRYKDDPYDRLWWPAEYVNASVLTTGSTIDSKNNKFHPPPVVMSKCIVPNETDFLEIDWVPENSTDQFYVFMHFAELQNLQATNQTREFNIYMNQDLWYGPFTPMYLTADSVYSQLPTKTSPKFEVHINKTSRSTLPPLINALEIFTTKQLSDALTDDKDVASILSIKSIYGLSRNWEGDPCGPKVYAWIGIRCSYTDYDPPRIVSLDMSSSNLSGEITPSIYNLTMLQSLDLSNNKLTGPVPSFLSQMGNLRVLNLKGNNFSSIPNELLAKSKDGSLSLSIDVIGGEDKNTSQSSPGNNSKLVPIVASVVAVVVVLIIAALVTLWFIKKRKSQEARRVDTEINNRDRSIEVKNRQFTYSEILTITNNFQTVVGKGGFGTVYHGFVGETQVAVKMLSPSSIQGYKEFQAEANTLMSVHHKNLTSLVGYCNEGTGMGIVYEYMANGNLQQHLSDKNPNSLSWEERLRISMDAAQGLEYLHQGCKPPIVHRDVKSTNILLNENFQAKLADFGLSRAFSTESGTHVSTIVAGTPGYLDPDYYTSNKISEKSDVYSFGVVILEIITGRPAIKKVGNDSVHVIQWANSKLTMGDITNVVDPRLRGDYDVNSMWKAVETAMVCVSRNPTRRPTMNFVVLELKECLAMETARGDESESSDNKIGFTGMNLESDLGPRAR